VEKKITYMSQLALVNLGTCLDHTAIRQARNTARRYELFLKNSNRPRKNLVLTNLLSLNYKIKQFTLKIPSKTGLKVNDQLVAYATRFLAVHLKNHVWSHHRTLKAKVQCDFSSAYSPDHTNVLRLINVNINIDITQPGIT